MNEKQPNRTINLVVGIVLGMLAALLVFALIGGLGFGLIYGPPAALGLIERVEAGDLLHMEAPGEYEVTLRDGPHTITSWRPILATPHPVEIRDSKTGEVVPLTFLKGGVIVDTELIQGTMLYTLDVPRPGRYEIVIGGREYDVWTLAPSPGARNTRVIALFWGIPLLTTTAAWWLWRRMQPRPPNVAARATAGRWAAWQKDRTVRRVIY